jgi:hypothetical protein
LFHQSGRDMETGGLHLIEGVDDPVLSRGQVSRYVLRQRPARWGKRRGVVATPCRGFPNGEEMTRLRETSHPPCHGGGGAYRRRPSA